MPNSQSELEISYCMWWDAQHFQTSFKGNRTGGKTVTFAVDIVRMLNILLLMSASPASV